MTDATARTAIVTGGARGIGAAIAARLAADGMAVGVLDLDEAGANAVAPGFIETEVTRGTAERLGIPFDEYPEFRS